jgi:hypothetical protein
MTCDNSTYSTLIVDRPLLNPETQVGEAKERDRSLASKSKATRKDLSPRIIPDRTHTDPEYVWGDEGPFND